MPVPPPALEATSDRFLQIVLGNYFKITLLNEFVSALAGPSRRQTDMLLGLAREYAGRFPLVTANTDREADIAREFGVKSLQWCKLFRHGKPVEHVHRMPADADYWELIERHLVPLADWVRAAALQAWHGGDREKAIRVLAETALAAVHPVADDYSAALDQFADLVGRDPGDLNGLPRRAIMSVLDTLDPDDERVRRYRQHLFDH